MDSEARHGFYPGDDVSWDGAAVSLYNTALPPPSQGNAIFAAYAIGAHGKQARHFAVIAVTIVVEAETTTEFLAVSPLSIEHRGQSFCATTARRLKLEEETHAMSVVAEKLTSRSAGSVHAALALARKRLPEKPGIDERAVTRAAASAKNLPGDGDGDSDSDGVDGLAMVMAMAMTMAMPMPMAMAMILHAIRKKSDYMMSYRTK